ncbi:MAG: DoxX family protein [Pseudomonadota bacterium]
MIALLNKFQDLLDTTKSIDFLGPLALRAYLAPVFWVAGTNKLNNFDSIVAWFEHGLGLPAPELMAALATWTEVGGAVLLVLGLATRWICIPLMVTMLVAAFSVHWKNGWQAVSDLASPWANANAEGAADRLAKAKDLLRENGNYEWLTETGNFVVSNNGIEWAITYFVMLLALFFLGAGKYLSVDHWIFRAFRR